MSYKILTIQPFDKQLKRLAKKYPSLKKDFADFLSALEINPHQGTALGNSCYKVRLAITSKKKGKSGGARVITNILIEKEIVYLLSIYDKSEKETLTNSELRELVGLIADGSKK